MKVANKARAGTERVRQALLPCVLTIAGSDSGGGAGIQADLRAITVLGGFGMTAITALTAQNTQGVTGVHPIPPDFVLKQIETIAADLPIHAAKTGMLATREIVDAVAEGVRRFRIEPLVVDPVLVAKGGQPLLAQEDASHLARTLFPLARLITPNLPEASIFTGMELNGEADWREAARRLLGEGPQAVLIKGGHGTGPEAKDLLFDGSDFHVFSQPRYKTLNTHGTGCTYSAAIATLLARGLSLTEAVGEAKEFITQAIRFSLSIGKGNGPTNPHAAAFRDAERFRVLQALERARQQIQARPALRELVPEVQSDLAFALPLAKGPEEIAAFPGGISRFPEGLSPAEPPAFGVSRHLASVILAAASRHPDIRSATSIRLSDEVLDRARGKGLAVAVFDGTREQETRLPEGSSLDWGTLEAIRRSPTRPDLVYNRGEVGREPVIRVLGTDPADVLRKLDLLT